jgi:hypothetical protein
MNDLVMNITGFVLIAVILIALSGCATATDIISCTINICN